MKVWAVEVTACRCCESDWEGLVGVYATEADAIRRVVEWAEDYGVFQGDIESEDRLRDDFETAVVRGDFDKFATGMGPGAYWESPDWTGLVGRIAYAARGHVLAEAKEWEVL